MNHRSRRLVAAIALLAAAIFGVVATSSPASARCEGCSVGDID